MKCTILLSALSMILDLSLLSLMMSMFLLILDFVLPKASISAEITSSKNLADY